MRIAIHDSLGQPEQVIRIEQTSRPKPKAGEVLFDYQDVIFKQAIIRGFWGLRKFAALSDEYRSRMISEIITLAQKDGLNLPVAAVYDLGDIAKAIGTKHAPGKVLLRGSDIER